MNSPGAYSVAWNVLADFRALQSDPWLPVSAGLVTEITCSDVSAPVYGPDGQTVVADEFRDYMTVRPTGSGYWRIQIFAVITPYVDNYDVTTQTTTRIYGEIVVKPVTIELLAFAAGGTASSAVVTACDLNLVVNEMAEEPAVPNETAPGAFLAIGGPMLPVQLIVEPKDLSGIEELRISEGYYELYHDYYIEECRSPNFWLFGEDENHVLHEIPLPYAATSLPPYQTFWVKGKHTGANCISGIGQLSFTMKHETQYENDPNYYFADAARIQTYGLNFSFPCGPREDAEFPVPNEVDPGCLVPLREANHQESTIGDIGYLDSSIDLPRMIAGNLSLSWTGAGDIQVWRKIYPYDGPWIEVANGEILAPDQWGYDANSSYQNSIWNNQFKITGTNAGLVELTAKMTLDPVLYAVNLLEIPNLVVSPEEFDFASTIPLQDHLHLQVTRFDIDMNSDNYGQLSHSDFEETAEITTATTLEEMLADSAWVKTGRIVPVNRGDADADGIPDFADGFDLDGIPWTGDETSPVKFEPVTITLPDGVPINQMVLSLSYCRPADPANVMVFSPSLPMWTPAWGVPLNPVLWSFIHLTEWNQVYCSASGYARLWTKDGDVARNWRSVLQDGDFVPVSGYDGAGLQKLGFSDTNRTVTLYLETVEPFNIGTEALISGIVTILPDAAGKYQSFTSFSDKVAVRALEIDLDVDSNNFSEPYPMDPLGGMSKTDLEDRLEDMPGSPQFPGKGVPLADGDSDLDGIPDFADGFDLVPAAEGDDAAALEEKAKDNQSSHEMVPLTLRILGGIDMAKATMRLEYDASDPAKVTTEMKDGVKIYKLPADEEPDPADPTKTIVKRKALRLWRGDPLNVYGWPSHNRNKNSILDAQNPGEYVPPGTYAPADLIRLGSFIDHGCFCYHTYNFTANLWLEGVRLSKDYADCRIVVYLDPDGPGPLPEKMLQDAVRTMVVKPVDLDVDSNNDGKISPDDETEDQIEAMANHGKFMAVNVNDNDENGFPDYADCSSGHPTGSASSLVPVKLMVSLPPGKTWDTCVLDIAYPAASPKLRKLNAQGGVDEQEPGTALAADAVYLRPDCTNGELRLWTKEGQFIAPGTYSKTNANDPTKTLGFLSISGNVVLLEFWLEAGKTSDAIKSISATMYEPVSGIIDTDTVNVTILEVNLNVDSDNDDDIDDVDDSIEDNPTKTGHILLTNTLDYTGDGKPDYANFEAGTCNPFTIAKVTIPPGIDLTKATVKFIYSDANPEYIEKTFSDDDFGKPTIDYTTGTTEKIRLWRKKGEEARDERDFYIAYENNLHGDHIMSNMPIIAGDLFVDSRTVELYLEGVNFSDPEKETLTVILDIDGDPETTFDQLEDNVYLTISELRLAYTDVTGLTKAHELDDQRIMDATQPDGIVCDRLNNVNNDGARLLLRVLATPILAEQDFGIVFGKIGDGNSSTARFTYTLPDTDGLYENVMDKDAPASNLTTDPSLPDDCVGFYPVKDADKKDVRKIFIPPFDIGIGGASHLTDEIRAIPKNMRFLPLAVHLTEGTKFKRDMVGSKPNAIFLARTPVVCIHGINSSASQWEGDGKMENFLENDGFDVWKADHGSELFQEIKDEFDKITSINDLDKYNYDRKTLVSMIDKNMHGNSSLDNAYPILAEQIKVIKESYRNGIAENDSISIPPELIYWRTYYLKSIQDIVNSWIDKEKAERKNIHKLKMAIQKVDLVGHSYGGVVSRWYTEKSAEYPLRRDARKLITIGSPHRGSPITNLCSEAYMDYDLYNAEMKSTIIDVYGNVFCHGGDKLGELLNSLNNKAPIVGRIRWCEMFINPTTGFLLDVQSPPMAGRSGDKIVPALQVLTVNSKVLERLNDTMTNSSNAPFNNDMAYACVIGKDHHINGVVNLLNSIEPYQVLVSGGQYSYAPWYSALDGGSGQSDAVVPVWSQQLFDPDNDLYKDFSYYANNDDHLSECTSLNVETKVMAWLKATNLPRGGSVRGSFNNLTSKILELKSRKNIYRGYDDTVKPIIWGGIYSDAIHRVRVVTGGSWPADFTVTDPQNIVLPRHGGLLNFKSTGTYRSNSCNLDFCVKYTEPGVPTMIDTMPLPTATGDLKPYSYNFWIGRNSLDLIQGRIACTYPGIICSITDGGQSFFNGKISVEPFYLDKPSGSEIIPLSIPTPIDYDLKGGVPMIAPGATAIIAKVALWDDDFGDDTMLTQKILFSVEVPAYTPVGALVPYSKTAYLYALSNDKVEGNAGNSGETEAEVYQKLEWIDGGEEKSLKSATRSVRVINQ